MTRLWLHLHKPFSDLIWTSLQHWDILHLKQPSNQFLTMQTTDTFNCAALLEHAHLCSCSYFSLWIFLFSQTLQHMLLASDFTDQKPLDPVGPSSVSDVSIAYHTRTSSSSFFDAAYPWASSQIRYTWTRDAIGTTNPLIQLLQNQSSFDLDKTLIAKQPGALIPLVGELSKKLVCGIHKLLFHLFRICLFTRNTVVCIAKPVT